MLYLLSGLGLAAVAASFLAWYYRKQAKAQESRATTAESAARNNAQVAKQLGSELKTVLAEIKRAQDEEAKEDEQEADKVVTAADASDFLNRSVLQDRGGTGDGAPARVPAKRKPRFARFVYGFGRRQSRHDQGTGSQPGPVAPT
jgi:hypothetical protein